MSADVEKQASIVTSEDLATLLVALPDSTEDLKERRELIIIALEKLTPSDSPLAKAMLECIATARERTAHLLQEVSGPSHLTESLPELEFHQKETIAVSIPVPPKEVEAEEVEEAVGVDSVDERAAKRTRWNKSQRLLYEDALSLFDLGDQPGAMTSIERLIQLNPSAEELDAFLEKNGEALISLYSEHFGSLDRVPIPIHGIEPVRIPTSSESMLNDILQVVDGSRTIQEIINISGLEPLRTLASIAHMARSGYIELA